MKNQEIWKPINGSNGMYYVSNLGNVKSFKYKKERILKPSCGQNHYPFVIICFAGQPPKNVKIHRLVAETFLLKSETKTQVNHIDGNKCNNRVENLEWVSPKENSRHSWSNGLCEGVRKLKSKPVLDTYTQKKYASMAEACRVLGLSYTQHIQKVSKNNSNFRFTRTT